MSESVSIEQMATKFDGLSCSQIETILNEAAMVATSEGRGDITESDIIEAIKRICNVASAKEAKRR